jgi:ElaB/YqjD/DUF883 family membrane-anchored ribosome-binding protein
MDATNNFSKQGHDLADKAAATTDQLRTNAAPLLKKATDQAQSLGKQGIDAVSDIAQQVQDTASDISGSIVAYTRKNPATALAIAAASGALLLVLAKLLTPSRD